MLPRMKIKSLMKQLGIKEEKHIALFLKRLEGWISKNGNTTISLLAGIDKILKDIHQKEIQESQKIKEINLSGVKNPLIKKYAKEIIELHTEKEFGVRRIQTWLWENHRAKISHSSIHRFLKSQNLTVKEQENG